jgi:hypothetical protein
MEHARDITDKAVDLTAKEIAQKKATQSGANPDRNAIRQSYAFIEAMFEPFSRLPDPARYDPLIADLNAAMGKLNKGSVRTTELSDDVSLTNPHLDKMTTDGGYLQGWTGDAAMAFKANFGCGKNQWSFDFSVLSAVGAVGGVVVAVVTGGVVPLAAIGALASVGSAGVAGLTASGDSAEKIINSMKQAIDELTRHVQEVETQQIADKVRALTEAMQGNKDKLVSARPNLAGMNDRDLVGDRGMGNSD